MVWEHLPTPPQTSQEAMKTLEGIVKACLKSYQQGHWVRAQMGLEDTLLQVLVAMKKMGLDPDRSVARSLSRMNHASSYDQTFHIFPDRVEIRVAGEYRGGWPVFSSEDIEAARQLAQELGCEVRQSDEALTQLDLFVEHSPQPTLAPVDISSNVVPFPQTPSQHAS